VDILDKMQQKQAENFESESEYLYNKIGQLKADVECLKKDRKSRLSLQEKRALSELSHRDISIVRQFHLLDLPLRGYYSSAPPIQETAENLTLMRLIGEEYTPHPFTEAGECVIHCTDRGIEFTTSVFEG
jgi:hypothetical protein